MSNAMVLAFFLSLFLTGAGAEAAESPQSSAVGDVVEFTVTNLDPPGEDGTSSGKFRVQLRPSWAPIGVERFQELTSSHFWEDVRIFRIVPDFVSQFGISSDPEVQADWAARGPIPDDDVVASNTRGTVTFATSGANSRTTQLFINTADNAYLDGQGFSPVGEVLPAGDGHGGMEVVDSFYAGYGELPDQGRITEEGISYLDAEFPKLSYFEGAEFVVESAGVEEEDGDSASSISTISTAATRTPDATEAASSANTVSTILSVAVSSITNSTTAATQIPDGAEAASSTYTASTNFSAAASSTTNATETAHTTTATAPVVTSAPEPEPADLLSAAFKTEDMMGFFIVAAVVGGMQMLDFAVDSL